MELKTKNICPNCGKKNEEKATICAYCSTPLRRETDVTDTTRQVEEKVELPKNLESMMAMMAPSSEGVVIYLTGDVEPFATLLESEFILGRIVEGIQVGEKEKIVDLTPFDAFEMGISRRHAVIRKTNTGYEISDLGSTNGTWLNGQRLIPYKPYPFNRAQIRIGQMRLFITYREPDKK